MKNKIILSLVFLSVIWNITSCTNDSSKNLAKSDVKYELKDDEKALSLLKTNCFTCHNPDLNSNNRVAPPLFKIREHYFDDEITKEAFVENIISFVSNPTVEKSIMPGAVRNFGLMPKTSFKEDDLKLIAAYLYHNDVSSDEWYAKWTKYEKEQAGKPQEINYEDLGRNIANETKANLSKNLMTAVKERGVVGAVDFCSMQAIPITDSMSVVLKAKIKRVSDKPRNQNNQANAEELNYIDNWKKAKLNNEKFAPKVFESGNQMIGYYPIETNAMCLQCHGTPKKQITPETLSKIKKLYPADKAFGYGENQIRGIFVVEMNKK